MYVLLGWELVILVDFDGEETLSRGYYRSVLHYASRCWPSTIHVCRLLEDGIVECNSYITRWRMYELSNKRWRFNCR